MRGILVLVILLASLSLSTVGVEAGRLPSILTCRSNAKASRDYAFREKRWQGDDGGASFELKTRDSKVAGLYYSLHDKVFSGLNTKQPVVRSIRRMADGTDSGDDFSAVVVSRTADAVFVLWTNAPDSNKVWLAAIDLVQRKATLGQVFQGLTSVGGELETLDCQ